jgi:protein-tyrosine-phosphatase/DNA-binding HxlR family transcriptional regulator
MLPTVPLPPLLKVLAHEIRWDLIQALRLGDWRVQELAERLGLATNLLSYHLKQLRQADFVRTRQSDADGRDIYYHLHWAGLEAAYAQIGQALALPPFPQAPPLPALRLLVICTHNAARSQMAEGFLRHYGQGRLQVVSAGEQPTHVHPLAIQAMKQWGIDISQHQAKPLSPYVDEAFDYVITVCDRAREVCPPFPRGQHSLHWSLPDPQASQDPEAFLDSAQELYQRTKIFLALLRQTC